MEGEKKRWERWEEEERVGGEGGGRGGGRGWGGGGGVGVGHYKLPFQIIIKYLR